MNVKVILFPGSSYHIKFITAVQINFELCQVGVAKNDYIVSKLFITILRLLE